jgi:hypothetical protein
MTVSFNGILRIDNGKFRTTNSIRGFEEVASGTKIKYNNGTCDIVQVPTPKAVTSYMAAENLGLPVDVETCQVLDPKTLRPEPPKFNTLA